MDLFGSPELNKMYVALQEVAMGIQRDFGEVENLQHSLVAAKDFVKKTIQRVEASIKSEVLKVVRPYAGWLNTNSSISGDDRDEFAFAFSGADNFVRGNPNFAISFALRTNDETKIAIIFAPILDKLYYAEAGNGAYLYSAYHSKKIKVSTVKELSDAVVCYNTVGLRPMTPAKARETGCPALDLVYVAAGKFDAFISDNLSLAELAAGELLIHEAGGKIDMGADIIATNGLLKI
ncbi:MAG: hypothetical protein MJ158_01410 [Alphaproteobacteria bacterium]|nr:hypothetical protein [Alphaproteobacteria bacterium]